MIESGPIPTIHGVVRWRVVDLCQWVWDEFQVVVTKQTLSRELRGMGITSCRRSRATTPRPFSVGFSSRHLGGNGGSNAYRAGRPDAASKPTPPRAISE